MLLHSTLIPKFSRCILQSPVLGAPLFSNPESIATKSSVYEKVKGNLNVKTVQELQKVPWQDLLKAFSASDPRAGLTHVPMIDHFFSENWRDQAWFARKRTGHVMIGNMAVEAGSVVSVVLGGTPKPPTPPKTQALIDALGAAVGEAKIRALTNAYLINPSLLLPEIRKNLFSIIEDLAFRQPTAQLVAGLQAPHPGKTPKVYQYSFEQANPFHGQFTGVADHALDLAYLHGDIGIFEGTLQPQNEEWLFGYDVKTKWIEFADGEEPWDHEKVMQFGPNYAFQEMELNTFLTEKWKSANWAALDS